MKLWRINQYYSKLFSRNLRKVKMLKSFNCTYFFLFKRDTKNVKSKLHAYQPVQLFTHWSHFETDLVFFFVKLRHIIWIFFQDFYTVLDNIRRWLELPVPSTSTWHALITLPGCWMTWTQQEKNTGNSHGGVHRVWPWIKWYSLYFGEIFMWKCQ